MKIITTITTLNPIKYTKSCKSMVADISEGVMPKPAKEKGENRSRILKEGRVLRIISGTAASIADARF